MRGVLQGYDRRYDRLVDWVTETEGTFRRPTGSAELPVADLLIAPISETRRPLAQLTSDAPMIGHRRRRRRHRAVPALAGAHAVDARAAVHRRELAYVAPKADPVPSLAARFAAREAVMKALGLGLGAFGFHDVWVERAPSGRRRWSFAGRAAELADDSGRARVWHLTPDALRPRSPIAYVAGAT